MSEVTKTNSNVEEVVQEIRAGIKGSNLSVETPDEHGDENLYRTLEKLNQQVGVQTPPAGSGLKNKLRLKLFRLLSPVFEPITSLQCEEVRALNKMTRLLDGRDDDLSGEVLSSSRKRMDLIEALEARVHALEEKMKHLEESNP